jgi:hypothetical protein
MKETKAMTYFAPEMEILKIEVEQTILSDSFGSSIENIGDRYDDQEW